MKDGAAGPVFRTWLILEDLIKESKGRSGKQEDGLDEERDNALLELGEAARRLLGNKDYQRLRLDGLRRVVELFVQWVNLDPSGPRWQQELMGLHYKASAIFEEVFRAEEIRAAVRAKMKPEGDDHGGSDGKR